MSDYTELNEERETKAWKAYKKYHDGFLVSSRMVEAIEERRAFYRGEQYDKSLADDVPKPVLNICWEYVEKVCAKLTDTPYAVQFNADDERNLHKLDMFYEYQTMQMNDNDNNVAVARAGLIDGCGCEFTFYDEDTYGNKGKYRGFLLRKVFPFEDVFFANPYCEEPQNQEYLGFVQIVSVDEARNLCEDESQRELIVPDLWEMDKKYNPDRVAFDTCTLVTRYFHDSDGEVVFEVCTRYVNLYKKPHYLNPEKNRKFKNTTSDETEDYKNMANEKIDMQSPAVSETDEEYEKKLGKFHRYPFAWFRPYPIHNSVLGDSVISQIMPVQKQINFVNMMSMLNFQNHSMGKWIVEEDALADGVTINNDPSQTIYVKSRYGQSVGNVVQRVEPSTVSAEQLGQGNMLMSLARQLFGYENLTSDSVSGDASGYALQQVQKQQNLVLEIPQQRLWRYIKEKARTDLLFFKFYVDEAKFYVHRSEGEVSRLESKRAMTQSVLDANPQLAQSEPFNSMVDPNTKQLPPTTRTYSEDIIRDDFMKDFEVMVDVIQGIAGSEIAESQHYSQVMQWIMSGNIDASYAKALVEGDPAFSRKVKSNVKAELDAYENGQIAQLKAQIDEYKNVVRQLQSGLEQVQQQVQYQNKVVEAYKRATKENAQFNKAIAKGNMRAEEEATLSEETGEYQTEGEVKSNNARGVEGTSFDTYVA